MLSSGLITASLALLAFVIAFYALLLRERKTPYVATFVYPSAGIIVVAVLLTLLSQSIHWTFPRIEAPLAGAGTLLFYLGFLTILGAILRLYNRHVHFRDDNLLKNLLFVRHVRHWWRKVRSTPSYEHDPPALDRAQLGPILRRLPNVDEKMISALTQSPDEMKMLSVSAAICGLPLVEVDSVLIELIRDLLALGWFVQYTTCVRHPYTLVVKLKATIPNFRDLAGRMVVIDGFSPHFGFTDSILLKYTNEITKVGSHSIRSAPSYAGIHTATAKAFNRLKHYGEASQRQPTLVIYEGCGGLVDLESTEQYRIFVRHVFSSERLWGGMLTLFVEPTLKDEEVGLIRSYADIFSGSQSSLVADLIQQHQGGTCES